MNHLKKSTNIMTLDKYNRIKPFETPLRTTIKSNYAYITKSDFDTLMNIFYDNEADKHISKSAYNCTKCKLKELKRVATEYFAFQAKHSDELDIKK